MDMDMDAVDIFLLYIVAFSVMLFLIVNSHEETRNSRHKTDVDHSEMSVKESDDDDDDWEGIERTELEKMFGEAVVFVSINGDQRLKLKLYGLQMLALQGPCHQSQPNFFNLSARSKWNAWEKVGEMSREMAMEKYINTLVDAVPDWRPGHSSS